MQVQTEKPTKPYRRGLVLQGGGGKGSFQYGVLRELKRAGVQFDIVSGTSVGALNGALVAADAWDIGDTIWEDLSLRRVFHWTGIGAIVTICCLPALLYCDWLEKNNDDVLPAWVRRVFALIGSFTFIIFCIVGANHLYQKNLSFSDRFIDPALALMVFCGGYLGIYQRKANARWQVAAASFFVGPLAFGILYFSRTYPPRTNLTLWMVLIASYLISPLLVVFGSLHDYSKASIFSNAPLRKVVEMVVQRGFKIPILVTAGERVTFIDPDYYGYSGRSVGHSTYQPAAPVFDGGYCPRYLRVDQLNPTEAAGALLASAALPFGVIPHSTQFKTSGIFVDGGITDNTPWFPLIEQFPCDEIVIVLCNPESDTDRPTKIQWRERDRAIRVMKGSFQPPPAMGSSREVRNDPPTVEPYRNADHWRDNDNRKFILLAPSTCLGNFITGTLNFSAKSAHDHIEEGRKVGRLALDQGLFDRMSPVKSAWRS